MADYRIGDEDIAGEHDEVSAEEIGAAVAAVLAKYRKTPSGMRPMRPTGITNPYGQQVLAKRVEMDASLYQVFGLGAVTLAVAGPTLLSQPFIERFKPGRVILAETAPGNVVTSIFVGVRNQAANLGAMPVLGFGAGAFETRVAFDEGEIGQPFTFNLLTVAAMQTISGMSFGTVVKHA